jgi:hypothetical protein
MYSKKSLFSFIFFPFCLVFVESSVADTSFSKKYAPYIGYEHAYSSYELVPFNNNIIKYTPRFFLGIHPIQTDSYKIGLEMGYMLPASYKEQYFYGYGENFTCGTVLLVTKNTDLYLTFRHFFTKNIYWFLKPGLEYYQRSYHHDDNHGYFDEYKNSSVYLGTRVGVGYNFRNGISVNVLAKSRFVDFNHNDSPPKKFTLRLDVQYSF